MLSSDNQYRRPPINSSVKGGEGCLCREWFGGFHGGSRPFFYFPIPCFFFIDVYQNWLRPVTLRERFSATEGSLVSPSEMLRSAQHDIINLCECQLGTFRRLRPCRISTSSIQVFRTGVAWHSTCSTHTRRRSRNRLRRKLKSLTFPPLRLLPQGFHLLERQLGKNAVLFLRG
jgi:hypothetical protein